MPNTMELRAALERYFSRTRRGSIEALTSQAPGKRPRERQRLLPVDAAVEAVAVESLAEPGPIYDAAADLLDSLGPATSFVDPYSLALFVEGRVRELRERPNAEEALVRELEGRGTIWRFDAPLATASTKAIVKFAESPLLELRQPVDEDGYGNLRLAGEVFSFTEADALETSWRLADTTLGGGAALGVIRVAATPASYDPIIISGQHSGEHRGRTCYWADYRVPSDLDELERARLAKDGEEAAIGARLRVLGVVLTEPGERAQQLRNACRLAFKAATSSDCGLAVSLAFSVIEGLLLDRSTKEDVLGRLTEAIVHSLARAFGDRSGYRKQVRRLYDARSGFVHTGSAKGSQWRDRKESLELMFAVLRREMQALDGAR